MVPISAAMLAPAKPVKTIAPINGPISRNIATPIRLASWSSAP